MKRKPVWPAKILVRLFVPVRVREPLTRFIFERIWRRVWIEEGYADKNNIDETAKHYASFRADSRDVVMTIAGFIPIGTIRLIIKRPGLQLPVEQDFVITKCWNENDRLVEVTLLTIRRCFRRIWGGFLAVVMMRYSYRQSRRIGAKAMVVAADKRLYILLVRIIRLPFHKIGEPKLYEGSTTVPAVMFLQEAEETMPGRNPFINELFRGKRKR